MRGGAKLRALRSRSVRVVSLPGRNGQIALPALLRRLAADAVSSVLIEGGAGLAAAALRARVVDRLVFFLAPKLIGGDGVPMVASLGVRSMLRAPQLRIVEVSKIGADLLVRATLAGASRAQSARG